MMKAEPTLVQAIRKHTSTGNERTDALVAVVRELVSERGQVSEAARHRFFEAGFSPVHLMEALVGIALKTISNYLDHFNPAEIDPQFRPFA
jgi:alkylhydroperoxidase family enzyme